MPRELKLSTRQKRLRGILDERQVVEQSYKEFAESLESCDDLIPDIDLQHIIANAIFYFDPNNKDKDATLQQAAIDQMAMILRHMVNSDEDDKGFIPKRFRCALMSIINKQGFINIDGKNVLFTNIEDRTAIFYDKIMSNLRTTPRYTYLEENLYRLIIDDKSIPQIPLNNDLQLNMTDAVRFLLESEIIADQESDALAKTTKQQKEDQLRSDALLQSRWNQHHKKLRKEKGKAKKYISSGSGSQRKIDPFDNICTIIVLARNMTLQDERLNEEIDNILQKSTNKLLEITDNDDESCIKKKIIESDIEFQRYLVYKRDLNKYNIKNIDRKIELFNNLSSYLNDAYNKADINSNLEAITDEAKKEELLLANTLQKLGIIQQQKFLENEMNKFIAKITEEYEKSEKEKQKVKNIMESQGKKWEGRLDYFKKDLSEKAKMHKSLTNARNMLQELMRPEIYEDIFSLFSNEHSQKDYQDGVLFQLSSIQNGAKISQSPSFTVRNGFIEGHEDTIKKEGSRRNSFPQPNK